MSGSTNAGNEFVDAVHDSISAAMSPTIRVNSGPYTSHEETVTPGSIEESADGATDKEPDISMPNHAVVKQFEAEIKKHADKPTLILVPNKYVADQYEAIVKKHAHESTIIAVSGQSGMNQLEADIKKHTGEHIILFAPYKSVEYEHSPNSPANGLASLLIPHKYVLSQFEAEVKQRFGEPTLVLAPDKTVADQHKANLKKHAGAIAETHSHVNTGQDGGQEENKNSGEVKPVEQAHEAGGVDGAM